MEKHENLAKAIIAVMQDVKGIEKTMEVGKGANAYKGVSDNEVKRVIGQSMAKNGLCMLPVGVEAKTQIDRWEGEDFTGKKRMNQSVFTDVKTKYMLLHESGQSQEICGYGQGVDPQDKGAGKATTYALKYALLYTFLVSTGKIDDADGHNSDSSTPPPPVRKVNASTPVDTVADSTQKPKEFIAEPIEKIKITKNTKDLTALFNSMPPSQQQAEHIIDAVKKQRETFTKTTK